MNLRIGIKKNKKLANSVGKISSNAYRTVNWIEVLGEMDNRGVRVHVDRIRIQTCSAGCAPNKPLPKKSNFLCKLVPPAAAAGSKKLPNANLAALVCIVEAK